MKVYFVRHGETDWNECKRLQGWVDKPLNSRGILQAEKLRQEIIDQELVFDICYSSPLQRVLKTAEIITAGKVKIVQDDLLKERSFGRVEGRVLNSWDEFGVDVFDEKLNTNIYDIEPILSLQKRAADFLEKLQAENSPAAQILVVTSGGILKRILYLVHHDRKYVSGGFHIDNCDLIETEI